MLIRKTGNLIDMAEQGEFDIIVHGCNCLNVMGGGIAKEIKDRHPVAYEVDTHVTKKHWTTPESKLGNYSLAATTDKDIKHPFFIINAYTQLNFAPRGVDHFEYESFATILDKLAQRFCSNKEWPVRFGFPYIGMGLAGGDKERIIKMLEEFAIRVHQDNGGSVTLVEFQP